MDTFLEVIPFKWYINLADIHSVHTVKDEENKLAISTKEYSLVLDEDEYPGMAAHIFKQLRLASVVDLEE